MLAAQLQLDIIGEKIEELRNNNSLPAPLKNVKLDMLYEQLYKANANLHAQNKIEREIARRSIEDATLRRYITENQNSALAHGTGYTTPIAPFLKPDGTPKRYLPASPVATIKQSSSPLQQHLGPRYNFRERRYNPNYRH